MEKKSFFKTVFFILLGLTGILLVFMLGLFTKAVSMDPDFPSYMGVYFLLMFLVIGGVIGALAVFTYKDASKRGMDPWMWMSIVVFVPNLIGFIIYLIVRKSNNSMEKVCVTCKKPVSSEFKLCPYCGAELNIGCPSCGREVSREWNLCPYCSKKLK